MRTQEPVLPEAETLARISSAFETEMKNVAARRSAQRRSASASSHELAMQA